MTIQPSPGVQLPPSLASIPDELRHSLLNEMVRTSPEKYAYRKRIRVEEQDGYTIFYHNDASTP